MTSTGPVMRAPVNRSVVKRILACVVDAIELLQANIVCLSFPYIYPEPVLESDQCVSIKKGSKKSFSYDCLVVATDAHSVMRRGSYVVVARSATGARQRHSRLIGEDHLQKIPFPLNVSYVYPESVLVN